MNTSTILRHTKTVIASATLGVLILSVAPSTVAPGFKARGLLADANPRPSLATLVGTEDVRQPYPSP